MIKTKHDVTIEIDGDSFKVTVSEITKEIKKQLDANAKNRAAEFEELDNKTFELKELEEEYTLNKQILSSSENSDVELLKEQKAMNKRISSLKKDISELQKNLISVADAIEKNHEEAFDLCVKGENASSLKKKIDETGISYSLVYKSLRELVSKAIEKK